MTPARHRHLATLRVCSDMAAHEPARPEYFVVMIDHGRRGREAVVDPEMTRAAVVERIRTKEYDAIAWIDRISDDGREDVTNELLREAGFYTEPTDRDRIMSKFDQLIASFDHNRDERKNWETANG